jgi:glucose/arabinose dehydrogenase
VFSPVHSEEEIMRASRRGLYLFVAVLVAVGGWFGAMGAVAQGDSSTTVEPGGDLPGDPSVQLVKVADGFIDPINVQTANDGSGRIFVIERTGTIRIIDKDGKVLDEPFLDISDEVKIDFLEQGLLGVAFHPDYKNNGRFFVYYSDYLTNGDHFLVEYHVSKDDPNKADPDSGKVLLTVDDPYVNHNSGTMHFGADGYLYFTIGDGGLAGDPYDNAQDLNSLHGKILRIDVDTDGTRPYNIPADNPYAPGGVEQSSVANDAAQTNAYHPDAAPEIWAYGLRNPWQFSFDSETGDMYIADVGQVFWEEINFVPADQVKNGGMNFGWDPMEASHCYPPDESESCAKVGEMPVAEFQHGDNGCSITGIGVYRGDTSPDLDGIYFSSDFCSGKVWGLERDDSGAWQFQELLDTDLAVTGAGPGEDGELYATSCTCQFGRDYNPFDNPTGVVWKLVQTDQVPDGAETAPASAVLGTPVAATPEG